ncbi:MAG: Asp-tRNA(Asn)/Glu-tRNA(Gln) amidotransferase subunit GatC [Helicobacteraceae bacterium]
MEITDELLQRLEKLAYLYIPDDKKEGVKKSLGDILEFAKSINDLDTSGAKDRFSINDKPARLREDLPVKSDVFKDLSKVAPAIDGDFFKVPKIIE